MREIMAYRLIAWALVRQVSFIAIGICFILMGLHMAVMPEPILYLLAYGLIAMAISVMLDYSTDRLYKLARRARA